MARKSQSDEGQAENHRHGVESACKAKGVQLPEDSKEASKEVKQAVNAHHDIQDSVQSLEDKFGKSKQVHSDSKEQDKRSEESGEQASKKHKVEHRDDRDSQGGDKSEGGQGSNEAWPPTKAKVPENEAIAQAFTDLMNEAKKLPDRTLVALSYGKAANPIRAYDKPIKEQPKPGEISGLGPKMCAMIGEFLKTGSMSSKMEEIQEHQAELRGGDQ